MPRIRKKKHERKIPEDKDIIVKVGNLRIYFQNYYMIISLVNDVLLGGLFLIGSVATLLNAAEWIRQWSYLIGALLMLMRPILKILRNIFIYDKEEFQEKISDPNLLGREAGREDRKDGGNYDGYEESKSREEKMKEIEKKEKNETIIKE